MSQILYKGGFESKYISSFILGCGGFPPGKSKRSCWECLYCILVRRYSAADFNPRHVLFRAESLDIGIVGTVDLLRTEDR